MKITLLNKLINDQKKVDKKLYLSGPYWNYKNSKSIIQLRKKGLKNFRGLESGVGTSFADNLILDFRNELNFKGRIVSSFLNIPYINKIFSGQLAVTSDHIKNYLKNTQKNLVKF